MNELDRVPGEPYEQPVDARLSEIVRELGFIETPQLIKARERITPDLMTDECKKSIMAYEELGINHIISTTDTEDMRPQIGLIVAMARLKYANGFFSDYRGSINDANYYADMIEEHEIARQIREIRDKDLNFRKRKS